MFSALSSSLSTLMTSLTIQNNSTVKLFADDTIIYHPINNQQDSIALQEDLDSLQRWESDWLMHFHPQKCQTMHITNKRNIIQSTYTIHNHKFQTTNTAKYLGIHIHSTLNWYTHINKTAQRANTTSAFLHRNIRTCPRKTKHLAYTTLVRPILEYASIIWDPHTASNINKLETVQRRSARHIMYNYSRHASVTTMLQHLDLPTLQQRCQHFKIIMLYRITHKLASIPTATYIAPCIRNTQHYILPYARTHVFKTSFFPSTIKIWNNLQPVITNSTTIPQLRQPLQSTPTSGRVLARDQSASLEDWQKLARTGEIVWFYNGRDRKKTGKIVRNGHFGRAVSESWLNP